MILLPVWLVSNIILYIKFDSFIATCNNLVWISIWAMLVIIKNKSKKFNAWLNEPINHKS